MIITDKFVFIHLPKTGGTFVTAILKKLYQNLEKKYPTQEFQFQDLMVPVRGWRQRIKGVKTAHGGFKRIPAEDKKKVIISCIRNPYDHYVSFYEFRYWERGFPIKASKIQKQFPSYPKLSFEEYLKFVNNIHQSRKKSKLLARVNMGFLTRSYIGGFFRDPQNVMRRFNDDYINNESYKKDLPDIVFLRTENLNQDLYRVLLNLGYQEEDIAFILKEGKIAPVSSTRKAEQKWENYYTKELFEYVRFKERLLFKLFPEYDKDFPN